MPEGLSAARLGHSKSVSDVSIFSKSLFWSDTVKHTNEIYEVHVSII